VLIRIGQELLEYNIVLKEFLTQLREQMKTMFLNFQPESSRNMVLKSITVPISTRAVSVKGSNSKNAE
jgi:hypothetical protein